LDKYKTILLLIILASALGLVTLGRYDLRPWDEPFYALRARAVAEAGAWLDQNDYCPNRMANACYPPLFVWLAGATMKVLGPTEFAARLWATLLGLASIPITFLLARRLAGDKAGLFAAGALAALPNFVRASRMAQFDAPVAFFVLLTFWLWVEYYKSRRLGTAVLCGVAFGLALMTKIAVPFVFVAAAAATIAINAGGTQASRARDAGALALVVAAGLAVAAPWHVYMYVKHGSYFLEHYVGYMVLYQGPGIAAQIKPAASPLRFLFYYNSTVIFLKGVANLSEGRGAVLLFGAGRAVGFEGDVAKAPGPPGRSSLGRTVAGRSYGGPVQKGDLPYAHIGADVRRCRRLARQIRPG